MKKAMLAGLVLFGTSFFAEAATLHRWPLDYFAPTTYSRWYDHNHSTGSTRRYDASTNRLNEDEHHGTDILGNISPTYIRSGAWGSLYYGLNSCNDNEGIYSTCGGGYGNHVRIFHNDGSGRVTIYAHMLKGTVVGPMSILCGGTVGLMGNSGASTGTHLHMEIWTSRYVSPASPHTDRLDLFGGPGNTSSTGSFWVAQNGTNAPAYPSLSCQ
ncbi:MAG: peptidoglycan DD-metalloendopeptidase family protein [bacterium]|nr:peptidoglycan DD-metalloendopeptidase family protein [bacterium]